MKLSEFKKRALKANLSANEVRSHGPMTRKTTWKKALQAHAERFLIGKNVLNKDAYNNKGLLYTGQVVEILYDPVMTSCFIKWDQGTPEECWFPETSLIFL